MYPTINDLIRMEKLKSKLNLEHMATLQHDEVFKQIILDRAQILKSVLGVSK